MFDPALLPYAIAALAAISVGLVVYLVVYPHLSGEKQARKRRAELAQSHTVRAARRAKAEVANTRRKQVHQTLKELEERQKAKKEKVTLRLRLLRAGIDASPRDYWIASAIFGLGVGGVVMISGSSPITAYLLAFAAGLGVPRWLLHFLTKRRQAKFLSEFANAIDVVVRGVKTGLPLNDCLAIIAREAPEPIRSEFAELVDHQRVGVPLDECFDRMMERMPLPEVGFFSIVLAIQAQAGGNLAEALGNLSQVLRDRKTLQGKVKALSAEAKASAMILGALPVFVMTSTYFASPEYISLLWKDPFGHILLAIGAFWMSMGIFVMRKMINFKY